MARATWVKCKGCEYICPAEPLSFEYVTLLSREQQDAILNMKAVYVFCKKRKEKCFVIVKGVMV